VCLHGAIPKGQLAVVKVEVIAFLFAFRLVLPEHNLKRALWTCA